MNRTVLITGASGGIGQAAALAFWQKGCNVVLHYNIHGDTAKDLCRDMNNTRPRSAIAISTDITSREQVNALFDKAEKELGAVEVLVNNAGIAQQKLFTDLSDSDWDLMFDVNVKGMFYCCQRAVPQMIRQKHGKIINVSSMWGQVGASCEVHYSAAKGAVIAFTKALAKELGPSGIQVNCVAPGVIDTPMNGHLSLDILEALKEETPLGAIGTPQDVAESILFLGSSASDFITGQILAPNGGIII